MKEFLLLSFAASLLLFADATLQKRFEYKHSFKGPHLVQKDRTVPFWSYVGNAIASDDFVRLAPSLKSQRGLIWNKIPTEFDNWEVEMTFKVSGRGRVGADGLAFWYTMENDAKTGPVFGARDQWNGLGVFFDSFDNDGQNNNPYVSAQINDGTRKFDHNTDGSLNQLGGCMRDYRNKPYPVRAKIRYENKVLTIYTSSGLTKSAGQVDQEEHIFDLCAYIPNIQLAKGGHFSVSAATGGVADDHDVISLLTHSLRTDDEMRAKQTVAEEERKKYEKEFEEFDKQLEEAKTEYQKENPEATQPEPEQHQELFDSEVRELRMIFEGQDHIHQAINNINKRLTELMGVSQQLSNQVAQIQQNANQIAQPPSGQPAGQPSGAASGGIQRHEVDHLVRASSDLVQQLNNLKNSVDTLSREKRDAGSNQFIDKTQQHQLTDGLNDLKQSLQRIEAQNINNQARNAAAGVPSCPNVNCISTLYFGLFIAGQVFFFVFYAFFSARRDSAAKKFY